MTNSLDLWNGLVGELVEEYKFLLASQSLYDGYDLEQEIWLILTYCYNNYNMVGDFRNYVRKTTRNRLTKIFRHQTKTVIPRHTTNSGYQESVWDYIPSNLSSIEKALLDGYLNGISFDLIAFNLGITKSAARNQFKELIMKIQEANE